MNRITASFISFLFHPLFLNFYLLLLVYVLNPYAFGIDSEKGLGVWLIMTLVVTIIFPLIVILMMKGLNMITSLQMPAKEERIGPLIAVLTCYIWYFLNINNNSVYPTALAAVALGTTLATGIAFFVNNFSKISLHTVGAGGFLCAIVFVVITHSIGNFKIDLPFLGIYRLSSIFIVFLSTIILGLVGTARLRLKVHKQEDIYGGYLVGIVSQIAAFGFLVF